MAPWSSARGNSGGICSAICSGYRIDRTRNHMKVTKALRHVAYSSLGQRFMTMLRAIELMPEGTDILETGTFRSWQEGGSTAFWLLAMETETVYSIDLDPYAFERLGAALSNDLRQNLVPIHGSSTQEIGILAEKSPRPKIGLLYLDTGECNHPQSPAYQLAELEAAHPLLVPGGVLL